MVRLISLQIILALISLLSFPASSSSIVSSDPNIPLPDLKPNPTRAIASGCPFKVEITTSCSSVPTTSDQIGLRFRDAYGNLVEKQRLGEQSGAFKACSTAAFDVSGPCTADICYVVLYRTGSDGWKVKSVRISSPYIKTATFTFNSWVPANAWFGYNNCGDAVAS